MIEVKHLTKKFTSGDTIVKAVSDVSFKIKDGTFASIVGKSGSGKSTMLALLGSLDRPTSGQIIIDEQDITTLSDHALIAYRCRKIGFVFQNYSLIPNLSALENVLLPMEFAGLSGRERHLRAVDLLGQVGLSPDKHTRKPTRLSGGEQQRVAIARAIANRPSLILADEPTGNLDSQTGANIIALLRGLATAENTTVIAVTHDMAIARQTDHTFQLQDGRLLSSRTTPVPA
jgi:putative ABC transport system ATP-binding protein